MPWYIGHYLAKTQHLSVEEHGAYCLLRMQYWMAISLPDDDERVRRIARMTERQWKTSREIIAALFQDGWRDPEIESEIMEAEQKYLKRSTAGRSGGNAKAGNLKQARLSGSNATGNARPKLEANGKLKPSDAVANGYQTQTHSPNGENLSEQEGSQTSQDRALPQASHGGAQDLADWDDDHPFDREPGVRQ